MMVAMPATFPPQRSVSPAVALGRAPRCEHVIDYQDALAGLDLASLWISRWSKPYSSSYFSVSTFHGSLPFFLTGMRPAVKR